MRVEAEYSTKPVVLSILFHLCVVTATMIGWPFLMKPANCSATGNYRCC